MKNDLHSYAVGLAALSFSEAVAESHAGIKSPRSTKILPSSVTLRRYFKNKRCRSLLAPSC